MSFKGNLPTSPSSNPLSAMRKQASTRYLSSTAMQATAATMTLASQVLGFEIVEIWSEEEDGMFCTYVHADESLKEKYPDIISGHYPKHKKEHKISPKLCQLAKRSPKKYHWRTVDINTRLAAAGINTVYDQLNFPLRTEMAYQLDTGDNVYTAFIVAFSIEKVDFKPAKLKFLSGLAIAIYVAAFDLDADDEDEGEINNQELDVKERHSHSVSQFNLAALGDALPEVENKPAEEAVPVAAPVPVVPVAVPPAATIPVVTIGDVAKPATVAVPILQQEQLASASKTALAPIDEDGIEDSQHEEHDDDDELGSSQERSRSIASYTSSSSKPPDFIPPFNVPTWDPPTAYSFPIALMPIKHDIPGDLTFESFTDLRHIADGSNSNIFLGRLNSTKVVVKLIKEEVEHDPVAIQEFELEYGTLARISHPNIISVLGAGNYPRKFIVLEWLGGGSLNTMLTENQQQSGLTHKLFKKPTFTYTNLLQSARAISEAFEYLHYRCHPGATFIHRDLKPDNVGFTKDGYLKLFDFGLVTCVKSRTKAEETYEMTGYTGSLRYMAPEVVMRQSYSEKADVYSFGIMLWQMARDKVPFKGLSKDEFIKEVVHQQERPKIDKSWPIGFSNLMRQCWDHDQHKRPTFTTIVSELNKLISQEMGETVTASAAGTSKPKKGKLIAGSDKSSFAGSSWF